MELDKKVLRRKLKERLEGLDTSYCVQTSQSITSKVISLPEYQQADTIFCFVGTASEIDTMPILLDAWRRGKRVGVPRCEGVGIMRVYEVRGIEDLRGGNYGILEPVTVDSLIAPEEIQFVVVPCLSCSRDGRRLGYGGGYYDRYLKTVSAVKCVICRKAMLCEEIPVEGHDVEMDIVVWE